MKTLVMMGFILMSLNFQVMSQDVLFYLKRN